LAVAAAALTLAGALARVADATFPGRNGRVVYSDSHVNDRPGESWLFTMDPDGGFRRALVRIYDTRSPRWSPDGRRVVFVGQRHEGDGWIGVMTVRADGTGLRRVVRGGDYPGWTPSGRRIVYTLTTRRGSEVWESRPDGSGRRRVAGPGPGYGEWSPDGSRLALVANDRVVVRDARGRRHVIPAGDPRWSYVNWISWSPNGRWLVLGTSHFPRCGDYYCPRERLWKARADGSGRLLLNDQAGSGPTVPTDPHWSPDGRAISYCRQDEIAGHWEWDRWTMRTDGTHRRLAARIGCDGDWAPLAPGR
jgi:Tol biopolymer transport system component